MLSLAIVSRAQGATYFTKEGGYYDSAKGLENSSFWGKGAEAFALAGKNVTSHEFHNLINGLNPDGKRILSNEAGVLLNAQKLHSFEAKIRNALLSAAAESKSIDSAQSGPGETDRDGKQRDFREEIISSALRELNRRGLTKAEAQASADIFTAKVLDEVSCLPDPGKLLSEKNRNLLRTSVTSAYSNLVIPDRREEKILAEGQKKEVIDKVTSFLKERDLSPKVQDKIETLLNKSIGDKKLSSAKIKSILGHSMKTLDKDGVQKADKLSIRKQLDSELSKIKAPAQRRVATDAVFSGSKSHSIQALIFGDERLIEAHHKSVNIAMGVVEEKYSNIRTGPKDDRSVVTKGNLIVSQFIHLTSRENDCQIHTHNVIKSLIQDGYDKNGSSQYKAMHTDAIFKDSKYLGTIYQNEMAIRSLRLGYEISDNGKGSVSLKGFNKEHEAHFSKRSEQIKELGGTSLRKARALVRVNRASKGPERSLEDLRAGWLKEAKVIGLTALKPSSSPVQLPDRPILKSLDLAILEVSERNVSFRKEDVHLAMLEPNLGFYSFKEIARAVDDAVGKKFFETNEKGYYVSLQALQTEKEYRVRILAQTDQGLPLNPTKHSYHFRPLIPGYPTVDCW